MLRVGTVVMTAVALVRMAVAEILNRIVLARSGLRSIPAVALIMFERGFVSHIVCVVLQHLGIRSLQI